MRTYHTLKGTGRSPKQISGFLNCTIITGLCGYLAALRQRGVWLKKGGFEPGPGGILGSKPVGNFMGMHYRWGDTQRKRPQGH